MLRSMITFGFVGLGIECVFTGFFQPFARSKQYVGKASAIWFLGYALTPVVINLVPLWAWYERGAVYLVAIYAIELVGNFLIKEEFGTHPSEYAYRAGLNYKGLVSLEPVRIVLWFLCSLFLEWLVKP